MRYHIGIDPGLKNLAVCVLSGGSVCLSRIFTLGNGKMRIADIAPRVQIMLQELSPFLSNSASVTIESQMSKKLLCVQCCLHTALLERGCRVRIAHPRSIKSKMNLITNGGYKKNKSAAVEFVMERAPAILKGAKKKDDLADAYITACFDRDVIL